MADDINVKALSKLGKQLSGLASAVEILESYEARTAKAQKDLDAKLAELASVTTDLMKAKADVKSAKEQAASIVKKASDDAACALAKADSSVKAKLASGDAAAKAQEDVLAGIRKRIDDAKLDEAAASDRIAGLTKAEADILTRIADHKAKLIAALG